MTTWEQIPGSDHPDQRGEVAFPFYAEIGPESDGRWSWTLLRANADGTSSELTGSGPSAHADSEELARALAEAAGLGALAQFETAEPGPDLPPLTCQYCRHAPATHVLVADLADVRAVHLICGPCGTRSLPDARRISKAASSAWLFALSLTTPETR